MEKSFNACVNDRLLAIYKCYTTRILDKSKNCFSEEIFINLSVLTVMHYEFSLSGFEHFKIYHNSIQSNPIKQYFFWLNKKKLFVEKRWR